MAEETPIPTVAGQPVALAPVPTGPEPKPPFVERRKNNRSQVAKEWTMMATAVSALAAGISNYADTVATKRDASVASAVAMAKLDESYKATRDAVNKMERANEAQNEKMEALREAVAELRGGLDALGVKSASKKVGAALKTIDAIATPMPTTLPLHIPEPSATAVQQKLEEQKK